MKAWLVAGLALAAGAAEAHDFWIQPQSFAVEPGDGTAITFQVGDGAERQRSPIPRRRILRFEAMAPDGTVRDLAGDLTLGASEGDAAVRFDGAGAHVLVLLTDAGGRSRLPAGRFNAYLLEEGLTPALEARAAAGRRRGTLSARGEGDRPGGRRRGRRDAGRRLATGDRASRLAQDRCGPAAGAGAVRGESPGGRPGEAD